MKFKVTNLTALTPGAPTFNTKFKATLFDGNITLVVTLASQLTHQIINNILKENSIFQIDNYLVAEIHGKRLVTVICTENRKCYLFLLFFLVGLSLLRTGMC